MLSLQYSCSLFGGFEFEHPVKLGLPAFEKASIMVKKMKELRRNDAKPGNECREPQGKSGLKPYCKARKLILTTKI